MKNDSEYTLSLKRIQICDLREVYMKGIDASYYYEGYEIYKTADMKAPSSQLPKTFDLDDK